MTTYINVILVLIATEFSEAWSFIKTGSLKTGFVEDTFIGQNSSIKNSTDMELAGKLQAFNWTSSLICLSRQALYTVQENIKVE